MPTDDSGLYRAQIDEPTDGSVNVTGGSAARGEGLTISGILKRNQPSTKSPSRKKLFYSLSLFLVLVICGGLLAAWLLGFKDNGSEDSGRVTVASASDSGSASTTKTSADGATSEVVTLQPEEAEVAAPAPAPAPSPEAIEALKQPSRPSITWKIDTAVMDYPYAKILGDSFLFFEAQRSGKLSAAPGGNRIEWRGDQLLDDGADVGVDLEGGYYEAGNRLKVTLATAYMMTRLALSCYKMQDAYAQLQYGNETMLHWCKREVRFGTDWLLKTHVFTGAERPETWRSGDKFIAMVGTVPDDFQCYQRAENLPTNLCPVAGRETLVADETKPAADSAGETAAALAAAAVLFQEDAPAYAAGALKASHALYDFATKYPVTVASWSTVVQKTYPTTNAEQYIMWASTVLAWAHSCEGDHLTCDPDASAVYLAKAQEMWLSPSIQSRQYYLVSNWDNPMFDVALLLDEMTAGPDSSYRNLLTTYISSYIAANGLITSTPLGLRRYEGETWASMRLATFGAYTSLAFTYLHDMRSSVADTARCLARSQLGYTVGDTGYSYVVGFGSKYPTQVHHRDAACTLAEDANGGCQRPPKPFDLNRPNPNVVVGSIVGGPDTNDKFLDVRKEFHYTEVALDYNTGLTTALAAMVAVPPEFWDIDCSELVPNYPWK